MMFNKVKILSLAALLGTVWGVADSLSAAKKDVYAHARATARRNPITTTTTIPKKKVADSLEAAKKDVYARARATAKSNPITTTTTIPKKKAPSISADTATMKGTQTTQSTQTTTVTHRGGHGGKPAVTVIHTRRTPAPKFTPQQQASNVPLSPVPDLTPRPAQQSASAQGPAVVTPKQLKSTKKGSKKSSKKSKATQGSTGKGIPTRK